MYLNHQLKSVSIPSELTAGASATDAAIQKKVFGSGMTTLTTASEELNNIMKTIKYLKDTSLLIKGDSETNKNEAKEQSGGFLSMLLGTFRTSLLGNLLTDGGVIWTGEGTTRADERTIRGGEWTNRAG